MAEFTLERVVAASPEVVFDASLDVGLHLASMSESNETVVGGPSEGLLGEGDTVTWRARHFGIYFRMQSLVYDVDRPRRFCDRQVKGPFGAFHHEHVFVPHPLGTLMRDTVTFRSPFGLVGRVVDRIVMRSYLRRLILQRNDELSATLESAD